MSRFVMLIAFAILACGGGGKKGPADKPDIPDVPTDTPAEVEAAPDTAPIDQPPPPDLPPDEPEPAPDLAPDPGPPDTPPIDPGVPDLPVEVPDLGDLGPQYSETVASCIYVMEGICDKAIKKCDEQLLGLIPPDWIKTCTDFLVKNDSIIVQGCLTLDNAQTTDPTVELIKTMGPTALKSCIDNFECTLSNIGKLGDIVLPIIKGEKIDTGSIIGIVAGLCFK